jgi:hypothetical protein
MSRKVYTLVLLVALIALAVERERPKDRVSLQYKSCAFTFPDFHKHEPGPDEVPLVVDLRAHEVYLTGILVQNLARCGPDEEPSCRRSCVVADGTHWSCRHTVDGADIPDHQDWTEVYIANGDKLTYTTHPPGGLDGESGMHCDSRAWL